MKKVTKLKAATSYSAALAAVGVAVWLRMLADPFLGDRAPFVTLFLPVGFAAWYGGRGPAMLALATSLVAVTYFVIEPRFSFAVDQPAYRVGLGIFALAGMVLIEMIGSLQRAEQSAAEKGERLRTTLASIGDGVITIDADGRVTAMNPHAESLTGWTEAKSLGISVSTVLEIINETSREPVENPALRALREGSVVGLANHTILIAKDGREYFIDDSGAPIRSREGVVTGAVLVFRDVSPQRSANRAQEQALATLNSLVASAPLGIAIIDRQMRFLRVNKMLAEMNGIPVEAHIGKPVAEIVPSLADQVATLGQRVLERNEALYDQTIEGETAKDRGVRRIWRQSWFPITTAEGETHSMGVIVQETTQERRAAREMAAMAHRMAALVDNTPLAVIEWDASFTITRWAGLAEKIFGWSAAEVVGKQVDTFPFVFQNDLPKVQETMAKLLEPANRFVVAHNRNYTNSGEVIECEWYNSVQHDEAGRLVAVLSMVLDVTEKKGAEARLKEADRRKDEFLATLAHELRNPLAPVMNAVELIKTAAGDERLIEEACATMDRQVGQMVRLIDDLLDVSRISRNKLKLRKEAVELASIVHHAAEACRPLSKKQGHNVRIALPPEPIYLSADPTGRPTL